MANDEKKLDMAEPQSSTSRDVCNQSPNQTQEIFPYKIFLFTDQEIDF
jgi:hypothetical protein